jgi:hypothetical protein
MNPVFATQAFWDLYLTLRCIDYGEDEIASQLRGLARDFPLRRTISIYDTHEEDRDLPLDAVEFTFSCGDRYSMVIEYWPSIVGCDKWLFLQDQVTAERAPLGWWDLARWHPYCLRQEELDLLLRYWCRFDPRWPDESLILLLFCQFVGLCDKNGWQGLSGRAEAAYARLGPAFVDRVELSTDPSDDDLPLSAEMLVGCPTEPAAVPLWWRPDYRWEQRSEVGWVFTSDEYDCYSLRNGTHGGMDFPYAGFAAMLQEVTEKLDRSAR